MRMVVEGNLVFGGTKTLKAGLLDFEQRCYPEFLGVEGWELNKKVASVGIDVDVASDVAPHFHEAFVAMAKTAKHGWIDLRKDDQLLRIYAGGHQLQWGADGTAGPGLDGLEVCARVVKGGLEAVAYYDRRGSCVMPLAYARKHNDRRKTAVVVREVGSSEERLRLFGAIEGVEGLAISATHQRVVGGSADGYLYAWDLETGALTKSKKAHSGGVRAVAIHEGQVWSVGRRDKRLCCWDLATLKLASERTLAFSPTAFDVIDGALFATAGNTQTPVVLASDALDAGAFFAALRKGEVAKVEALLKQDSRYANVPYPGDVEMPPLVCVPQKDTAKAIALSRLLLAHGADPAATSCQGISALGHAKDPALFNALKEMGAVASLYDLRYIQPEQAGAFVPLMVKPGDNGERKAAKPGFFVWGLMQDAIAEDAIAVVEMLLERGADVNQPLWKTHWAVGCDDEPMPSGSTMLDIARVGGREAIAALLEARGGTPGTRQHWCVVLSELPENGLAEALEALSDHVEVDGLALQLEKEAVEVLRTTDAQEARALGQELSARMEIFVV